MLNHHIVIVRVHCSAKFDIVYPSSQVRCCIYLSFLYITYNLILFGKIFFRLYKLSSLLYRLYVLGICTFREILFQVLHRLYVLCTCLNVLYRGLCHFVVIAS